MGEERLDDPPDGFPVCIDQSSRFIPVLFVEGVAWAFESDAACELRKRFAGHQAGIAIVEVFGPANPSLILYPTELRAPQK